MKRLLRRLLVCGVLGAFTGAAGAAVSATSATSAGAAASGAGTMAEWRDSVLLGDLLEYELAPRAEQESVIVAILMEEAERLAG